jgi:hypothetical protein
MELAGYQFDRAADLDNNGGWPVVWVDVHTGLGWYRRYNLLTKNSHKLGSGGSGKQSHAWMSEYAMGYG